MQGYAGYPPYLTQEPAMLDGLGIYGSNQPSAPDNRYRQRPPEAVPERRPAPTSTRTPLSPSSSNTSSPYASPEPQQRSTPASRSTPYSMRPQHSRTNLSS